MSCEETGGQLFTERRADVVPLNANNFKQKTFWKFLDTQTCLFTFYRKRLNLFMILSLFTGRLRKWIFPFSAFPQTVDCLGAMSTDEQTVPQVSGVLMFNGLKTYGLLLRPQKKPNILQVRLKPLFDGLEGILPLTPFHISHYLKLSFPPMNIQSTCHVKRM